MSAQSVDSTGMGNKRIIPSVRDKLKAVTNANAQTLTDTLKNLLTLEKGTSKVLALDSLQQKSHIDSTNNVTSHKQKITSLTDSLTAISNHKPVAGSGKFNEIQNPIDSVTKKIRSQQDSIANSLVKSQQRIQEKVNDAPAEVKKHASKINDKLTTDVSVPGEKLNTPLNSLNVPSEISTLSTNGVADTNIEIPNTETPSVGNADVPIPEANGIDLPDELNADALKEKINLDIPESDKIQEAQEKVCCGFQIGCSGEI